MANVILYGKPGAVGMMESIPHSHGNSLTPQHSVFLCTWPPVSVGRQILYHDEHLMIIVERFCKSVPWRFTETNIIHKLGEIIGGNEFGDVAPVPVLIQRENNFASHLYAE